MGYSGNSLQHRSKTHRQETSERIMEYWEHNAHLYRTWLIRYQTLLVEKRQLGLRKGRTIPEHLISEYPEIPLFRLKTRGEVEKYIDNLSKQELDILLGTIKRALSSRAYSEIKASVYDLDYTVRYEKRKRLKKSQKSI